MLPGKSGEGVVRIGEEERIVWGPKAADPETSHRCTLVSGIGPMEHLSAAAAILGVRGWLLEAEHGDLPLFDGSAAPWAELLEPLPREPVQAGFLDLPSASWEGEHRGRVEANSASEFQLVVEWSAGPYGPERWEGSVADLHRILSARTFIDADEWWEARRNGHLGCVDPGSGRLFAGRAVLPERALEMLGRDGVQPVGQVWTGGEERVPMECAAHKALDLVGDIACAIGYLPALRIVARDAGHTLHAKLSRALRNANSER